MLRALLSLTLVAAACHSAHTTEPIVDPGPPPLPPSSGTAIGILLDDAGKLALRDDQIDKLRAIDSDLAAREDQLTARERPPARSPDAQAPGPQHKGRGGGSRKAAARHARALGGATDPDKAKSERTATEHDAITRALDVLDPGQRETARKLLDEHGYMTTTTPAAVEPTEQPGEPDDGNGS